jgi:hypothetical protein
MATPTMIVVAPVGISPLAPPYYLGRPAHLWIDAVRPRWRPTPVAVAAEQPTAAAA